MKKITLIIIFILLNSNNSFAKDTFVGKWINDKSGSIYEIKKNGDNYEMYLLFGNRFFREYKNKLVGSFKKTKLGYKGNFIASESNYPWKEIDSKATYKLKKSKILSTVKGVHEGKKFKFKGSYSRVTNSIVYDYGEELFGVQIGKTIDNYKLGSFILVGDEKFKVKKRVIYPTKPNDSFGTYLIRYHQETKQIYSIDAYLKLNSSNLSYTQCRNIMQPYKNYAKDKYSGKFELGTNYLTLGDVLINNGTEVYGIFIGCEEREGSNVGYISLYHKALSMDDYSSKNKTSTEKKEF